MKNLLLTDLKVLLRIPLNLFFSNVFPIFMCTILLMSYGNFSIGDGYHFVDKQFLIGLSLAIPPIALVSFGVTITEYVHNGILERYHLSHISTKKIMVSQVLVHCLIGVVQFFVLVAYLTLVYQLHIKNVVNLLMLLLSYIVVLLSTLSFGFVMGIFFKRREITLTASMVVMFIMYFFSGCFIEFDKLPEIIKSISDWIPLKYLAQNSFQIFNGSNLFDIRLYVTSFISIILCASIGLWGLRKKFRG